MTQSSEELVERCVEATFEQFGKERGTMPDPYAAARICIRLTREHDAAIAAIDHRSSSDEHDCRVCKGCEQPDYCRKDGCLAAHVCAVENHDDRIAELEAQVALLPWLAENPALELSFNVIDGDLSDCAWLVHECHGGHNDREWTLIAHGETPLEALSNARATLASQQGSTNNG